MPAVLTKSSVITCGHAPGQVDLTAVASKLTVSGDPVVVVDDVVKVVGCSQAAPATACLGVTPPLSGVSTKLTVGGKPVMLETVSGKTSGVPPGTLKVLGTVQQKLSAV